jgi:cytochrome c biogenesis protein CcmG/thiol:disulfide interchange protein DsbE
MTTPETQQDTSPDTPKRSSLPPWMAVIPAALLLVVGGFFAFGLTRDPQAFDSGLVDRAMPTFALAPLTPERPALENADLVGKVSLVNVFGSWCASCVLEHPQLTEIANSGAVNVYGIDWRDPPGAGAAWLERYGDPYAKTGVDSDSRLAIDLGVTGAPETFIVDRGGRIRYKQVGPITADIWNDTLLPLIQKLEAES